MIDFKYFIFLKESMSDTLNPKNAIPFIIKDKNGKLYAEFKTPNANFEVVLLPKKGYFDFLFYDTEAEDNFGIELNNKGNVKEVFATVIKILQKFIMLKHKPIIVFTSEIFEKGRVKIYNRFIKQVHQFISEYEGKVITKSNSDVFYILYPSNKKEKAKILIKQFSEKIEIEKELENTFKEETKKITEAIKRKRVVRDGKIQWKKFSTREGYKVKDGKEIRVSYHEKYLRKLAAKRAAIKRRTHQASINRKRKRSMRKRKSF